MIKNITLLFFVLISLLMTNLAYSSSTSSYLISKAAFKLNDFQKVFDEFDTYEKDLNLLDYQDILISLVNLKKINQANKIAIKILDLDSDNQEALMVIMVNFLINNKKENINKEYYNTNNELINFIFFENKLLKSNYEISISFLELAQNFFSNSSSYKINYSYLLFYLSLSASINIENDKALFMLGQIYQIMEKYEDAELHYNKIKKDSIYFIDAKRNIAFNYSKFLDYNEAEKKIIDLIKITNNNNYIIKILADFYRINKKYQKAINHYDELILLQKNKTNSDLWNLFYLRGVCFERINKWQLAEKDLLYSLELKYDSPNVLNYLAYGWIERDIYIDRALLMLEKAYKANPDSYYILDSLAWAHYKKNNLQLAANLMEKVIVMAPGEAISLDHLGDIYFSLNRKREAVFLWKQAKDLAEPEDEIKENIENKLDSYYER